MYDVAGHGQGQGKYSHDLFTPLTYLSYTEFVLENKIKNMTFSGESESQSKI